MISKVLAIVMQRKEPAIGCLYLVGTPIGNLGDLSPRARNILASVDVIACEDTRHSSHLLRSIKAYGRKISFHQHNTITRLPQLLKLIKQGKSLAVISDAGLPGISDPGEALAAAAQNNGLEVICIPGPCAATTALISSGLPSDRFCFEGFIPVNGRERRDRLAEIALEKRTTLIYESPHRLLTLLKELSKCCGEERPVRVTRELTKLHEEQVGPNLKAALEHFLNNHPKGEFTLVLGGNTTDREEKPNETILLNNLKKKLKSGVSNSDAARELSQESGISRREIYSLLHRKEAD